MKKYIFIASSILLSSVAYGQVELQNAPNTDGIVNDAPFLDASGYTGADMGVGKGLLFPRTDLTTFEFKTDKLGGFQFFSTAFDGMIVYNTKSGKTGNNPATQGIQVDVEPGFYYFSHPGGDENTTDVSAGKWVRIGGGASTSVAGANVATGTFTHAGGIQAVLGDNVPTDLKAITGIKIVRIDDNGAKLEGGVAATTFYSYDKATRTISFGQGVMATSMPKGEYHYTIEYTK